MTLYDLTPVERIGKLWLKREDKFEFAGCNGSKVKGALYIIQKAIQQGYDTFVSVRKQI